VGIVEDVVASAEWIATALTSSGYRADFAATSLWEIERFFAEQSRDGRAIPGGIVFHGATVGLDVRPEPNTSRSRRRAPWRLRRRRAQSCQYALAS
jgi:hypothetical protein